MFDSIWHLIHSVTQFYFKMKFTLKISSLEYPSSKWLPFKISLLPLGTWWSWGGQLPAVCKCPYLLGIHYFHGCHKLWKSDEQEFPQIGKLSQSELSSTKPVCYCAWQIHQVVQSDNLRITWGITLSQCMILIQKWTLPLLNFISCLPKCIEYHG